MKFQKYRLHSHLAYDEKGQKALAMRTLAPRTAGCVLNNLIVYFCSYFRKLSGRINKTVFISICSMYHWMFSNRGEWQSYVEALKLPLVLWIGFYQRGFSRFGFSNNNGLLPCATSAYPD
ncbi:MAG TPA: hypothetical protein H9853_05840 [Candidatus Sphingobacterium stercoripullorum]|uniref:Uncharacterized protein n=1 Tax=Candidatus Sphingobacterium stercoripullorum TaxID=2838759 RepID=A0A9D1W8Q0_9SPHI|nr:hypothetical protein [Candidatus Sphingobacterium stercoripullorum]